MLHYTDILHADIFSIFMIWDKVRDFSCISKLFVDRKH